MGKGSWQKNDRIRRENRAQPNEHFLPCQAAADITHTDPSCPRCHGQPADYVQMFWSCPRLWSSIFEAYSKLMPVQCVLSLDKAWTPLKRNDNAIVVFTSLLAGRSILLSLKAQNRPSITRRIKDIMHFLRLEKIRYTFGQF